VTDERDSGQDDFVVLEEIVERRQTWPLMAARFGLCDALDTSCGLDGVLPFKERRDEEDELSATRYADLPYPENQLMSLAHSLLARGVITEDDLRGRLATIRARLECE
jgi:hypothetical protein